MRRDVHLFLSAWAVGASLAVAVLWVAVEGPSAVVAAETASQSVKPVAETAPLGIYLTTGVGDSMQPTMGPGDRSLCVEHVEPEIGDVVLIDGDAIGNSHNVGHRVVAINESTVVTKGDGNDLRDDPAPRRAVLCTTVWAEGAGWNP